MPFFKQLSLVFLFLLHYATSWAQNADSLRVNVQQTEQSFTPWWRVDAVEMGGTVGKMLVTDQYQRAWTQQTDLSAIVLTLRHRTTTDSIDAFAHDYNHPSWGLSLQWTDLSRVKMQKNGLSLVGTTSTGGLCFASRTYICCCGDIFTTVPAFPFWGMGI